MNHGVQTYNPAVEHGKKKSTIGEKIVFRIVLFFFLIILIHWGSHWIVNHLPVPPVLDIYNSAYSVFLGIEIFSGVLFISVIMVMITPNRYALKHVINSYLLDGTANHLVKNGLKLPKIKVCLKRNHWQVTQAKIRIKLASLEVENLTSEQIGRMLNHWLFQNLAITDVIITPNQSEVVISAENVTIDWQIRLTSFNDMAKNENREIVIDKRTSTKWIDSPHMLVVGKTRSGKTAFLGYILANHISVPRQQQLVSEELKSRVLVVDPKGQDFYRFSAFKDIIVGLDPIGIMNKLIEFEKHMNSRMRYLGSHSLKWQDVFEPSLIVIDEFASIAGSFGMVTDKETSKKYNSKEFNALLLRLISRSASSGCFVVVSVVQADSTLIPTNIRAQFGVKLALRPDNSAIKFMFDEVPEKIAQRRFSVSQGVFGDMLTRPKVIKVPYLNFNYMDDLLIMYTQFYG